MLPVFQSQTFRIALLALACWLAWTAATVHFNYQDNWTALFCTGTALRPPAELAREDIYRFPNKGYDGQMYHYMAHDPFIRRGFSSYLDNPRYRYGRILIPLLAWTLAAGNDVYVDLAYYAIIFLCLFLGTWWLSQLFVMHGKHAAWGLLFALSPPAVISLDRMTVDIAMATLTIATVLFVEKKNWIAAAIATAMACLCRETGVLLVAAVMIHSALFGRDLRRSLFASLALLPAAAWFQFMHRHTAPYTIDAVPLIPLYAWAQRLAHPQAYPLPPFLNGIAVVLDDAALMAIPAILFYAVKYARIASRSFAGILIALNIPVLLFANIPDLWTEPIAWGRVFGPLLLLLAIDGVTSNRYAGLLPLSLCGARVLLLFATPALGVVKGLLGMIRPA